jgi:hypothetical protein
VTGEYDCKAVSPLIALSKSAHVIAIASGSDVELFSGVTGELDAKIESIFEDHIMAIGFDPLGLQLFVAGDRQIRVFFNLSAHRVRSLVAQQKLREEKVSEIVRDRLESQIAEDVAFLSEFDEI